MESGELALIDNVAEFDDSLPPRVRRRLVEWEHIMPPAILIEMLHQHTSRESDIWAAPLDVLERMGKPRRRLRRPTQYTGLNHILRWEWQPLCRQLFQAEDAADTERLDVPDNLSHLADMTSDALKEDVWQF